MQQDKTTTKQYSVFMNALRMPSRFQTAALVKKVDIKNSATVSSYLSDMSAYFSQHHVKKRYGKILLDRIQNRGQRGYTYLPGITPGMPVDLDEEYDLYARYMKKKSKTN